MIIYKEVLQLDVLCSLHVLLLIIIFHEHRTHVILEELKLIHRIYLSLNEVYQPQKLWQVVVCYHYIGFR